MISEIMESSPALICVCPTVITLWSSSGFKTPIRQTTGSTIRSRCKLSAKDRSDSRKSTSGYTIIPNSPITSYFGKETVTAMYTIVNTNLTSG